MRDPLSATRETSFIGIQPQPQTKVVKQSIRAKYIIQVITPPEGYNIEPCQIKMFYNLYNFKCRTMSLYKLVTINVYNIKSKLSWLTCNKCYNTFFMNVAIIFIYYVYNEPNIHKSFFYIVISIIIHVIFIVTKPDYF